MPTVAGKDYDVHASQVDWCLKVVKFMGEVRAEREGTANRIARRIPGHPYLLFVGLL